MPDCPLDLLQVFFGAANNAEARVYARLPVDGASGLTLAGKVEGPDCLYAKSLPTSFRLTDRGPGTTLLAEAIVSDPCFWSSDLPALYQVDVELRKDGKAIDATRRTLGIRLLGVSGSRFFWEGKNWVVRAARRELAADAPLAEWREAMLAMIVTDPDEALLAEASRQGVMIVADVSSRTTVARLQALARWPAVVLAIVAETDEVSLSATRSWPNLLLARRSTSDDSHKGRGNNSIRIVRNLDALARLNETSETRSPLIVERMMDESTTSVGDLRAACDRLQGDAAGRGEIAGYFIF